MKEINEMKTTRISGQKFCLEPLLLHVYECTKKLQIIWRCGLKWLAQIWSMSTKLIIYHLHTW